MYAVECGGPRLEEVDMGSLVLTNILLVIVVILLGVLVVEATYGK